MTKNPFSKVAAAGKAFLAAGILSIGMLAPMATQNASAAGVTFNSTKDCNSNAVMYCGAMNTNELTTKYNGNESTRDIFEWFGITNSDIAAIGGNVHAGYVTKSGDVYVGSKKVATNAVTAGRQNITGSQKVTHDGTTFYTRSPSVSFRQERLDAFVVLNQDGQFRYAVIASCGNPVKATNVVPKPAKPVVKPVAKPPVCEFLDISKTGKTVTVYQDQLKYELNGATLKNIRIDFGDGTKKEAKDLTALPVSHTYTADGTYTIKAYLVTNKGEITSVACQEKVTITTPKAPVTPKTPETPKAPVTPVKPVAAAPVCELLTLTQESKTVTVSDVDYNLNGATLKHVVVDFGDGNKQEVTSFPISHTYAADGTYTIKAYVVTDKGEVTAETCEQQVTVSTPVVQVPVELPKAGPASLAGLFVGSSALAAAGHALYQRRKF